MPPFRYAAACLFLSLAYASEEGTPQSRFWKHHLEQKTLFVDGVDQWNNMEACVETKFPQEMREELRKPSTPQVSRKIAEDDQIFFVAIENAMTPLQAEAVQHLAGCIQTYVPSLYNSARALYQEKGLDEDDGSGGNTPTVLNPIMSIFLPEIVEVVYRALETAYKEADWSALTLAEEEIDWVEHRHPLPRECGIRVAEHLSYDNFRSLGDHDDGYGGTAYTVNFALSGADEYEGGEVFLMSNHDADKKWHYKPDKYTVMAFLGGEYMHGVTDITSGHRELFSSEFWILPDTPLGNTLVEAQPDNMRGYIALCDASGEDPCKKTFADVLALQVEEEDEYFDDEYEYDYDEDEDEDYYDEEEDYEDEEEYDEEDLSESDDEGPSSTTIDFMSPLLKPLAISPLRWLDGEEIVSPYAFRAGLPPTLTEKVLDYCNRMGITDSFRRLLIDGHPSAPDTQTDVEFNGFNWFILRPGTMWHSNMHWIGPADAKANEDMLQTLSAGGFDSLLDLLGETFDLDGIAVYHVGFMAVSQCDRGFVHSDFTQTGGKGWHIIFPLVQADDTSADLNIFSDDETVGGYKYEMDTACVIGDDVPHATAKLDYTSTKEMRVTASIYLADINEENAESIADEYSTTELPEGDPEWLLTQAGIHWSKADRSRKLPQSNVSAPSTNEPPVCKVDSSSEDCVAKKE